MTAVHELAAGGPVRASEPLQDGLPPLPEPGQVVEVRGQHEPDRGELVELRQQDREDQEDGGAERLEQKGRSLFALFVLALELERHAGAKVGFGQLLLHLLLHAARSAYPPPRWPRPW